MITNTPAIRLLVCGESTFDCIIKCIRKSQISVHIKMFIWRDDLIGNKLANELLKAANRGVKIQIYKDRTGAIYELAEEKRQSFFHKTNNTYLKYSALLVNYFYPLQGKTGSQKQRENELTKELSRHKNIQIDFDSSKGDHSKYYIFDNNTLILGGINIEDKEISTDVSGMKYHDYMIEFNGSIYVDYFLNRLSGITAYKEENKIDFIFNIKNRYEIKEFFLNLIESAKHSIDILMAYIGDKDIHNKIIETVNRGIKVNIILPAKANLQNDFNYKLLKKLITGTNGKINIYLSPDMIHAKLILVDNKVLTIGSSNLNSLSMSKLFELNTLIKLEDNIFRKELINSIISQINISKKINHSSDLYYNKLKAFIEGVICG